MRFVVDAQLPPAFARWLVALGHQAEHVLDLGLESSHDEDIWDFAHAKIGRYPHQGWPFQSYAGHTGTGPSIIWIRTGNTTTPELFEALGPVWDTVIAALESGEPVVEVG